MKKKFFLLLVLLIHVSAYLSFVSLHSSSVTYDNSTDTSNLQSNSLGNRGEFSGAKVDLLAASATTKQYYPATLVTIGTAEIVKAFGYNETIHIQVLAKTDVSYLAFYKEKGQAVFIPVPGELVKNNEINIIGLKGNMSYDVRISSIVNGVNDNKPTNLSVYVGSYDRSGYAHFNYTDGVGAYNDDGTLKSNAIVLYVTEQNKNTIKVPGFENCGTGIGYILNNNESNLKLITANNSLAIRFIGKVTNPNGTTIHGSTQNGGSASDNGCMARIKGGRNITLEGVGTTAMIYGWGFHFIASAATYAEGYGKSFEVRNLTFDDYPEDALGMEGEQSGSTLTSPVERCFVHHNTFLSGYCANPVESDKAEGDGSCDFKRGKYYTLSYNTFNDCHKTNLIGSAGTSLQYHITMHHNYWNSCMARAPLSRQANIHMYNNYFNNTTDYAMNVRANALIFSEANYFENVKKPYSVTTEDPGSGSKVGGVVKVYNDVLVNVTNHTYTGVVVNNRQDAVTTNNIYGNFDTNSSIFYYDSVNKKSQVSVLTDALGAKNDCLAYSGVMRSDVVSNDESEDQLLAKAVNALNSIPSKVVYTVACYELVLKAKSAYDVLSAASKAKIDYSIIQNALNSYDTLDKAKARELNNNLLTMATITLNSKALLDQYQGVYNGLLEGNKSLVTNYSKLTEANEKYNQLKKIDEIIKDIDNITVIDNSSRNAIMAIKGRYDLLTASEKQLVTNSAKLLAAVLQLQSIVDAKVIVDFSSNTLPNSDIFTFQGNLSSSKGSVTYDSVVYNTCLKIESSTAINVNLASAKTLTLVFDKANTKVKIDGNIVTTNAKGIVTLSLSAGSHTITKSDTINLFVIVLE